MPRTQHRLLRGGVTITGRVCDTDGGSMARVLWCFARQGAGRTQLTHA